MLIDRFNFNNVGQKYIDLRAAMGTHKKIAAFYATQNLRYFIASKSERFFVYIVPDRLEAKKAYEILNEYSDKEVVYLVEKDEILLNMKVEHSSKLSERIDALIKLATNKAAGIVISTEALMQYLPKVDTFLEAIVQIEQGKSYEIFQIIEKLVLSGYKRVEQVTEVGEFAHRGDILDIWPVDKEMPIRASFFDDELEELKSFAPDTMMSTSKIHKVLVPPNSDILLTEEDVENCRKNLLKLRDNSTGKLVEIIDENLLKLEVNRSSPSLIWAMPFAQTAFNSIFSYLPNDALIFIDEPNIIDEKLKLYKNAHDIRVKHFMLGGEASAEHLNSLISREKIYKQTESFCSVCFQASTGYNPIFYPEYIVNLKSLPIPRYTNNYQALIVDLKQYATFGSKVYIFAGNDTAAINLNSYLRENDVEGQILTREEYIKILQIERLQGLVKTHKDLESEAILKARETDKLSTFALAESFVEKSINIVGYKISEGFNIPEYKLVLIGTNDVIRKVKEVSKSRRQKMSDEILPEQGDYVVHDKHGIGISEGIQSIETLNGIKDFYVIKYADESKLYLPVDHINELSKYTGGGTPKLHKIGGYQFEKIKEKVKASIKAMAIDLVSIYKKRLAQKGYKYAKDTVWQEELEDSFEFEETDDQLKAIADIKDDMEKGKIMDRLICGDVGFGKTEVAIRAIFKTIMDGKQAALLTPTTILCQQHFNTISERLQKFGIHIVQLSRFVDKKQINSNLKDISSGKASVIVATHRMLSKDVMFDDLGLLVLDEEQKFGVEHKEKIKLLKNNINVLSLSATPIPRTLHMSLTGIRDISLLETPPVNRLPIETYVVEQTDSLIYDACMREIARGGQVFILYNRVQSIVSFYNHIQKLLGQEVEVVYAHGQMSAVEIEQKVGDFYNHKAQVMIATTIIENGIDIPSANTLIVINSDKLGLSELYQIRGRVGRSQVLAYAYFTIPQGVPLTTEAQLRLTALMKNTELGSGMKIAMADLEIRGAGSLLGREQHGNMGRVGYDMYTRLLNESVDELEGRTVIRLREIEVNLPGDMRLDKEYIPSSDARIKTYREISDLFSQSDLARLKDRLEDTYGKIPRPLARLMLLGLIKNLGQKLGIKSIDTKGAAGDIKLEFYDEEMFKNESLFKTLLKHKDTCSLEAKAHPLITLYLQTGNDAKLLALKDFLLEASEGI